MAIMRPLGLGWGVSFWSGEESGVGVCFLDTVVVGDHHHHHRLEFRFGERRMVRGKRFPYAQVLKWHTVQSAIQAAMRVQDTARMMQCNGR